MIPACNITDITEKLQYHHDYEESCVVGVMFARYGIKLTQEIINECYQFWHKWSGKKFDMFWVGYGEYVYFDPSDTSKISMTFPGNDTNNYFDIDEFIDTVQFFSMQTNQKWTYSDKLQLMLINYSHSKLRFNEYITVDLEENLDMYHSNIRQNKAYYHNSKKQNLNKGYSVTFVRAGYSETEQRLRLYTVLQLQTC